MKRILIVVCAVIFFFPLNALSQQRWVTGYMPNWDYSGGNTREFIGQGVFTHLILFAVGVDGSGNLTDDGTNTLAGMGPGFVDACHDSSIKAMFCIFPHQPSVVNALSSGRANFAHSICNEIRIRGWDGVDFDYEDGFTSGLDAAWAGFMHALRDSLNALGSALGRPLYITAFTFGDASGSWYPSSPYVDKFSLAGYEMAGAWGGWPVWHGYCLYSGGYTLPCCPTRTNGNFDSLWVSWVRRGIPRSKLLYSTSTGVSTWNGGLMMRNLYGAPFTSGNGALHAGDWWEDAGGQGPNVGVGDYTNYNDVVTRYGAYPEQYDSVVVATYKVVDNPGNSDDHFISYAGPRVYYEAYRIFVADSGAGGFMVWNGWRGRTAPNTFPQLASLKAAIAGIQPSPMPTGTFTATPDSLPNGGGNVLLTWTSQHATSAVISGIGSVALNGSQTINISGTSVVALTLTNTTGGIVLRDTITVAGGGSGTSFSDNFNRANGGLGSDWTTSSGSPVVNSNRFCTSASGSALAYWSSSAVASDQFSKGNAISVLAGNRYVYFGVRMGSGGRGYFIKTDGSNSWIVYRASGGSDQVLQTLNTIFSSSDVAEIKVNGSTLSAYKNGFQIGVNQTHSALTSGSPGLGVSPDNNTSADNWQGGGLLPSGQGHQDITIQALGPIALITQPTGSGSRNIEIIRDGFTPPVGSSDPSLQYDTYDGGGARSFDWIGYQFPTQHTFSSVTFQEGMQFTDGGWFASLGVQVRVGGQWVDVQNFQSIPPYAGANGINFETYELSFTPLSGDAIRIAGNPGGSAHYISVGELRVFDNGTSSAPPDPIAPRDFALMQNYPNPFNPATRISFNLPIATNVTIRVYNVLGQEISTLAQGPFAAGRHFVDFSGDRLPNGIYFYAIDAGSFSEMKKMVLLK